MTTGMTRPASALVAALNSLQKAMMLTPCWPSAGPTGGAGLACPAWICSLISPTTFFFGAMTCSCSFLGSLAPPRAVPARIVARRLELGDLGEGQLDRCFAAENGHQHLELLLFGVDLADRCRQRRERTVHDGDGLADLEVNQNRCAFNSAGLRRGAGSCRLRGLLRGALRQ